MTVQHNGNYLISVLINKSTLSDWFLKNNQIINPQMPRVKYSYFDSIIWQQAYHKRHCLYRIWCICPISKKRNRRMSRDVLEEDNVPIFEAERMETKKR